MEQKENGKIRDLEQRNATKTLRTMEEKVTKTLEQQEELTRSIKSMGKEITKSHGEIGEEQKEITKAFNKLREETTKHREKVKEEINRALEGMKEIALRETKKNQSDDAKTTIHPEGRDIHGHSPQPCPLCAQPLNNLEAAIQHVRDHHTLSTPQPLSPTLDDPAPVEVREEICGVSGKTTYECTPGCKPGNHYGNTMKLKDIKARNEQMKYKWEPHICGSPTTTASPEHAKMTIRIGLASPNPPSLPVPKPASTNTTNNAPTKDSKMEAKQPTRETSPRNEPSLMGEIMEVLYGLAITAYELSPATKIMMILILITKHMYGFPMISTASWPMSARPSAWAPSNLTSPGRSLTTGTNSPLTDTPETSSPDISNQLDTSVDITTLLKIACFTLILAGIAALVIIKRRIRTEEQEEEECPQDDGKDEEDLLSSLEKCWTEGPTYEPAWGTACQTIDSNEIASAIMKMNQQLDDLRALQLQL